jgi:two-component system, chemotaxis family, protein-glutamate methylesterase/glutaminase
MSLVQNIRIVIADDTALYRKILTMAVERIDGAEMVGSASDGVAVLELLKRTPADLVLLDVCMPRMDGVEALKEIHRLYPSTAVVMFSGVTSADADTTLEALEIGALEFIPKPKTTSLDESMQVLSQELARVVRLLKIRKITRRIANNISGAPVQGSAPSPSTTTQSSVSRIGSRPGGLQDERVRPSPTPLVPLRRMAPVDASKSLIVIGVSTGGPNALNVLMAALPRDIGCPILMVQHMPPFFTASLASFLSKKTGHMVKEGSPGELIKPNTVYLAPGGKHMVLERGNGVLGGYSLGINENPTVNSCRPSVDVLFKSVAEQFSGPVVSVILTGMGEDGCDGVALLKNSGNCYSIAQDESTCVVYGMPRAVAEKGLVDEVLPLEQIASRLSELMLRRKAI